MWRSTLGDCTLALFVFVPAVSGQTYEELKKENEALKARIQALEAARPAEGVVVSYDPATGRLVVRIGDKERTVELKPRTHVHDPDGYEVSVAERPAKLTPGVKIEVVEEDGQLEINILGDKGRPHKHDGDHKHDDGHKHEDSHFDYFRPAHSHGGGPGNGHGHGGHHEYCPEVTRPPEMMAPRHEHGGHSHARSGHSHGNGQSHNGHGHQPEAYEIKSFCDRRSWHKDEEHGHGHNGHGHNGHGSVEGYPFFHSNRIEPAWVERALEITWARAKNADGGIFNEYELEAELIWAVNDRIEFIIAIPYVWLDPTGKPELDEEGKPEFPGRIDGFGDLELGVNFLAFNGERMKLKAGLAVTVPVGRDALSANAAILEPVAFGLLDFGGGWVLHGEAAFEIPIHVDEVENEFRYGLALHKTLLCTEHFPCARWLTPMIEANGLTVLNGPAAGQTVLDLTPGLRWIMREHDDVGFGISFPVTKTRNFVHQFIFTYLIHF